MKHIPPHKLEWFIILHAVNDFYKRESNNGRVLSNDHQEQMRHFAKQGVKVRLK